MSPTTPKLSVVIITWNERHYIADCLDHLIASIGAIPHEIILVDNNSTDRSKELVREKYPQVVLIENAENVGIAKARNIGLRRAQGEYVLIIDIDTKAYPTSVPSLIRLLDQHARVGVVGPRLVAPNGALQHSCRQFPTIISKLTRIMGLTGSRIYREEVYGSWHHNDIRSVGYIIGACQLFRRAALEQVGYYREYKLYGPDDLEICLRLWLHGWQVVYNPEAVVVHVEQRQTRRKLSKITFFHFLALMRYFREYRYAFNRNRIQQKMNTDALHFPFPPM